MDPRPIRPGPKTDEARRSAQIPAAEKPPKPPRHLNKEAKREFRRLADILHKAGVLTQADTGVLEVYCDAYAEWVKLTDTVSGMHVLDLMTVTQSGREMPSPLVRLREQAYMRMMRAAAALGITPTDRKKVAVEAAQDEADDATEFINIPIRRGPA